MKKVAIIGGTGLIGRSLAEQLLAEGFSPVIVTRRKSIQGLGVSEAVRHIQWDGRSAGELAVAINGFYGVVNLAGEGIADKFWSPGRKKKLLESRYDITKNLISALALLHHKPEVLLQGSAVGYYGPQVKDADEQTAAGKGFLAELTMLWESAAFNAERLGIRTVYLRTGIVLTQHGGALPKMLMPFKLFVGGNIGSGRRIVPWIHLKDEVNAIVFLLMNPEAKGAFNLVSPEKTSQQEMNKVIAKRLHRPLWLPIPAIILLLLPGRMGKEVFLSNQHVKPTALRQLGFKFAFEKVSDTMDDLLKN